MAHREQRLPDRHLRDLTGSTAQIVKGTFTNASSGKSVALSISLISLLITGLDVSATAQVAYARAFTMAPLRGIQKYLRGAAWLILLLMGPPNVLGLPKPASSISTSRTFGDPGGASGCPIKVPVGLRSVQRLVAHPLERQPANRKIRSVGLAHCPPTSSSKPSVPGSIRALSLPVSSLTNWSPWG